MDQQKMFESLTLMQKVDKCMCSDLADYIRLANRHKYSTVYHQVFPTDETQWSLVSFEVWIAVIYPPSAAV
jgi:hypothetical protein